MIASNHDIIIDVNNLRTYLGNNWVHNGLDFTVQRNEIVAIVGGSGSGKTTLLREIIMLNQPTEGEIWVLGKSLAHCDSHTARQLRQSWGVLFQQGALFSTLSVLDNLAFPLHVHTNLLRPTIEDICQLKLKLVGLDASSADKFPSELSGGMLKRVALARAIALDPWLLFLDEPTAGLDPQSANALDQLILTLKQTLGLTIVIITHDLDTLWQVADKVIFLGEGKILAMGSMEEVTQSEHPMVKAYFMGPRGRVISQSHHDGEK